MDKLKKIAVIICNYNKKDYVKRGILSLRRQNIDNFDIYLVDNASTDGTADEMARVFADKIHIIRNTVNLGGSGGFNTGIRNVMDRKYPYMLLLDNDVELKEDCIEALYSDMERNPDVGIMGAKILKMDYPDRIQEFAPTINYETLTFELNYGGEKDDGLLPHLKDCDYVPACALMVRREVVEEIGYLPEENFIYYDDIIWGIKCHRAGYRVTANSHATVWHKGGAGVDYSTFVTYYLNRNKFKFFMTYLSTEEKEHVTDCQMEERAEHILMDLFEGIYSCQKDGRYNMAKTRMDAFLDAVSGTTGKAEEYEIRHREVPEEKFEKLMKKADSVLIYMNGYWENTRRILYHTYAMEGEWGKKYQVELVDKQDCDKMMLGTKIHGKPLKKETEYDLVFHVCKHVYELKIIEFNCVWIDGWRNLIADQEDFDYYKLFAPLYRTFKLCFEDRVIRYMKGAMENKDG